LNKLRGAEARKVKESLVDAQVNGKISLPRSDQGESRIPNVEKYKVSDGDRLIVQVVDGVNGVSVFLFTGTHDDTERWLNNHPQYKWVARKSDNKLDFVQVSEATQKEGFPMKLANSTASDVKLPASKRPAAPPAGPLLSFLKGNDWAV